MGRRVIAVPVLILVNIAIFVVTAFQAHSTAANYQSPLFTNWALAPGFTAASGEWWRLFTTGFLHIGPVHLLINMISLWIIGRDVELLLGRIRFVVVYVLALFGGSAAVFLFGALDQPVAGASGALYGLMGCVLVAVVRLKLDPKPVLATIALNLVISVTLPGISLLGHLGGLLTGLLAMAVLVYLPAQRRILWQIGALGVLAVLIAILVVVRNQQIMNLVA